jgi:hypothetical protein
VHARPDRGRRRFVLPAVAVVVVALVAGVAVGLLRRGGDDPAGPPQAAPTSAAPAVPSATATFVAPEPTTPKPTPACGPWGCVQERRFAVAGKRVDAAPGRLGITVLDRTTGRVWNAGTVTHPAWASSTPKLALTTALLEGDRAGRLTLDARARAQIAAMLATSDDDSADALWDRYGGADLLPTFRDRYGMSGLTFVAGFPRRWGFLKCTPADLRRLMTYVLTRLDPADRAYVVGAMRTTGPIQHWGVWAAGPAQRPGGKDGWSVESDGGVKHWLTSSVGFAGPGERYVVAVMDDLPPGAGIGDGVHAVSDVVATVFGAPVPAPVTVPDESTGR